MCVCVSGQKVEREEDSKGEEEEERKVRSEREGEGREKGAQDIKGTE